MSLALFPHEFTGLEVSKANQACLACRKQKRKCDKTLPDCGLCVRMGRPCDYTEATTANPTAEDFAALQNRLADLESRLAGSNGDAGDWKQSDSNSRSASASSGNIQATDQKGLLWAPGQSSFPVALLLDFDAYAYAGLHVPKPPVDIPADVLTILSEGNVIEEVVRDHFDKTHPFMPIISKKRIYLGISLSDGGPDLAMLFLAMKLLLTRPGGNVSPASLHLYQVAKRFLALLESSGAVSLVYLQSLVLVTLYEMGQAIYPAAWMSVGACVRYVDLLCLASHKYSTYTIGHSSTWTEVEERRRTWWAVFILDRVISLGSKRRMAMADEPEMEVLPCNDDVWDQGDMARALQQVVSTPSSVRQSPFARLCQVCILVGRVVKHCRAITANSAGGDARSDSVVVGDFRTLFTAMDELGRVIDDEMAAAAATAAANHHNPERDADPRSRYFSLLAPRCLVWSAAILLGDLYSCPENVREWQSAAGELKTPGEVALQPLVINVLQTTSVRIRDFAVELLLSIAPVATTPDGDYNENDNDDAGRISPLVLDSWYCALACLQWLFKESGDESLGRSLADVQGCLQRIGRRWRVGEDYASMLMHPNITNAMTRSAGPC